MSRGVLCPKCATPAAANVAVCPKCGTALAVAPGPGEDSTSRKGKAAKGTTDKHLSLDDGEQGSSTAPFKAFVADAQAGATIMDLDSESRTLDGPPNLITGERLALQLQPKPEPPKPGVAPRRGAVSGLRTVPAELQRRPPGALANLQAAQAAAAAAPPPARKDPLIGEKLGEYIVEEKIGSGGMGVVYRARQPQISGTVAIKVLRGDVIADKRDMERLLDEARVVNAIKHRGIINIFGAGELQDGRQYLVMEYLEGETLEKRLERVGKFTAAQALPILDEVLAALAAAHGTGIVHRDLKPANVFLVKQSDGPDLVKLLDFGLARRQMQEVSRIAGTPDYISPEHARGRPAGPPADLYGLGILAFHMLTGQLPFRGNTPMEMMEQHVHSPPPVPAEVNPQIPSAVSGLILTLLEKDPSKRPEAAQAKLDLRASMKQVQQLADKEAEKQNGAEGSQTAELPVGATPKDGMLAMTASSSAELDPRLKVLARKADVAKVLGKLSRNWPWVAAGLGLVWLLGVVIWMSFSGPPSVALPNKATPIVPKKPPPMAPVKAAPGEPPRPIEAARPVEPPRPPEPVEPPKPVEVEKPVEAGKPPEPVAPVEPRPAEPVVAVAPVRPKSIGAWRLDMNNQIARLEVRIEGNAELQAYRTALNTLKDKVTAAKTPEEQDAVGVTLAGLSAKIQRAAE